MNNFRDLVIKNRSIRRFDASVKIELSTLLNWIDIVRFTPSGRNLQPLKFMPICTPEENDKVFETLAWAGYLTDWAGPVKEEQPTGYIVILHDKSIAQNYLCDDGICAQTLMLAAVNDGYGGCILAAINRPKLKKSLNIPDNLEILLVLAFGKSVENVIVEPMVNNKHEYYRDAEGNHYVPKRGLDEIVYEYKE
ncbi:MAG: nitroreductase family protein [Salinivirgaceae bacterium]|nr:nitroreductase family protein [Salinivirgaceae bacterium]